MSILEVETDDIGTFKSIVEILNGIVSVANAEFYRCSNIKKTITNDDDGKKKKKLIKKKTDDEQQENDGYIKIFTVDPNQVMIIYITLKGSQFKKFFVNPTLDKYTVGLDLDELYKYIKNVDKEGTMTIKLDGDDTQRINFNVKGTTSTSNESICELRVVNEPARPAHKIELSVSMKVRINCQAFHKACKDLHQFSQFVEITCDPSQLVITCKGELSSHKRIFKSDDTQDSIKISVKDSNDDDIPNIIRFVIDLKYINMLYKCTSLCDDMFIHFNTDSIMFLQYDIKLMGQMMVGISPSKKKQQQNDYDENAEGYYQDDDEIEYR